MCWEFVCSLIVLIFSYDSNRDGIELYTFFLWMNVQDVPTQRSDLAIAADGASNFRLLARTEEEWMSLINSGLVGGREIL